MNHAVIGMGEVGRAHAALLKRKLPVWEKDLADVPPPAFPIDVMHVALDFHGLGESKWREVVDGYLKQLRPRLLSILSTVPPGTAASFGDSAVHSTTRGLHPNLVDGLLKVPKHIGGPQAEILARDFRRVGIRCVTHAAAKTTELAHILNNSAYGVALMFADEMARLCREYGVDYFEAVMKYTATHNEGFTTLDHGRLVRPILTPPYGRIGGHCVTQGATLIPADLRGELLSKLAGYGLAPAAEVKGGGGVQSVRPDSAVLPVDGPQPEPAGGEAGGGAGPGSPCGMSDGGAVA